VLLDMYRRTGIAWYADQLSAVAQWMLTNLPEAPEGVPLIPRAFHQHMEFLLMAYQHTGDRKLLAAASRIATQAEKRFWTGQMLRGVSGIYFYGSGTNYEFFCDPWATDASTTGLYHSISGTPLLVRSLMQLAFAEEGETDQLGIDPHRR